MLSAQSSFLATAYLVAPVPRIPSLNSSAPTQFNEPHFNISAMAESCPAIISLEYCKINSSYIRPDIGVAIMPVIFTIPLFLTQCFALFTRLVFDWRDSQLLSHVIAFGGIVLTIVAYISTSLQASQIYVWTPVSLIVDVGTIMHLIVITREDPDVHFWVPRWAERLRWKHQTDNNYPMNPPDYQPPPVIQQPLLNGGNQHGVPQKLGKKRTTFVFCLSHIWLLAFIILQIVGLAYSLFRLLTTSEFAQSWCSPAFQIGNETYNTECTTYNITQQTDLGIACVNSPSGPAGNQKSWLGWTAATLALQLLFELGDGLILLVPIMLLPRSSRQRFINLRQSYTRPILTMISGLFMLFAMVVFGWLQMSGRPKDLSGDFLGIRSIVGSNISDCRVDTYAGGVRGTLLAWSDGIFHGIKGYAGTPPVAHV
jgi:hypothetical protein